MSVTGKLIDYILEFIYYDQRQLLSSDYSDTYTAPHLPKPADYKHTLPSVLSVETHREEFYVSVIRIKLSEMSKQLLLI